MKNENMFCKPTSVLRNLLSVLVPRFDLQFSPISILDHPFVKKMDQLISLFDRTQDNDIINMKAFPNPRHLAAFISG